MAHRFTSLLFLLVLALLAGCKKQTTEPQPAPLPVKASLNRSMVYQNSTTELKAQYENAALNKAASQASDKLSIGFWTTATPVGSDGITFTIANAKRKTGLVGTYALGTLPNPEAGDAKLDYRYQVSDTRTAIFLSSTTLVEGTLQITAYDSGRSTISGSYTVRIPNAYDPYATTGIPEKRVTFTLTGTFENVPLKNEP